MGKDKKPDHDKFIESCIEKLRNKVAGKTIACDVILDISRKKGRTSLCKFSDDELPKLIDDQLKLWDKIVKAAAENGLDLDENLFENTIKKALPQIYEKWRRTESATVA